MECGGTIEMWRTPQEVATRVQYIETILKKTPMLGSEHDYPAGTALLRIHGAVKPGAAQTYEAAWQRITR